MMCAGSIGFTKQAVMHVPIPPQNKLIKKNTMCSGLLSLAGVNIRFNIIINKNSEMLIYPYSI